MLCGMLLLRQIASGALTAAKRHGMAKDARGCIGHVPVVQLEADVLLMLVLIEMIDATGIERGGAAFDAMHEVTLAD
jgi:hypothetical protein